MTLGSVLSPGECGSEVVDKISCVNVREKKLEKSQEKQWGKIVSCQVNVLLTLSSEPITMRSSA